MKTLFKALAFIGLVGLAFGSFAQDVASQSAAGITIPQNYQVYVKDPVVYAESLYTTAPDTVFHLTHGDVDTSITYDAYLWDKVSIECYTDINCDTCAAATRDSSKVSFYLWGANYDGTQWTLVDSTVFPDTTLAITASEANIMRLGFAVTWPGYKYAKLGCRGLEIQTGDAAVHEKLAGMRLTFKGVK